MYIANRVSDKVTAVDEKIYVCRSGSAADTQAISDYVTYFLDQHRCRPPHPGAGTPPLPLPGSPAVAHEGSELPRGRPTGSGGARLVPPPSQPRALPDPRPPTPAGC